MINTYNSAIVFGSNYYFAICSNIMTEILMVWITFSFDIFSEFSAGNRGKNLLRFWGLKRYMYNKRAFTGQEACIFLDGSVSL